MTQSRKIILAVAGICSLSLLATLNLIRRDDAKRSSDSATENRVGEATARSPQKMTNDRVSSPSTGVGNVSDDKNNKVTNSSSSVNYESAIHPKGAEGIQAGNVSTNMPSPGNAVSNSDKTDTSRKSVSAATETKKTSYPGIEQKQNRVMVRDVRYKALGGEDQITVTLTVNDDSVEVSGRVWVIAEYVQRGTTGVMYMPSHDDLTLTAEGKPQNPDTGLTFSMRFNTEKKFNVKRPGFEGEELTAIKVGVWDKKTGNLHMARMPIKHASRKSAVQRAKVEVE